jgi:hypothetical protein
VQAWRGHAQPPSRLPEPATRSPANHDHADRADHADRFGYRSFTGRFKYQGTASCASMDCHHGTGPAGMKGSEYSLWADRDPHSKAYAVLFEERSKAMLRLYRGLAAKQPSHPEADALCLKCHAISVPPEQRGGRGYEEDRLEPVLADGVGCEGCHGPAERWRTTHYLGWWKQLSHQQKLNDYGLIPTKDLAARVQVCAACHIGAPEMEVNHQLIAAGHPRLNFEYTLAHHNYPRHWRERYGPDFEYRAWVIGQVASARAALVLLRYRAEQAAKSDVSRLAGVGRVQLRLLSPGARRRPEAATRANHAQARHPALGHLVHAANGSLDRRPPLGCTGARCRCNATWPTGWPS